MKLTPVEAAFKAALADATDWLVRWPNAGPNYGFPEGVQTTQGGLPLDAEGEPAPFIDARVIGGETTGSIAPAGSRAMRGYGLLHLYFSVGEGTGTELITAETDAVSQAFERVTVWADPSVGQRLGTLDPRTDDGVAAYENGDRFVRLVSVPWFFEYRS